MTQLPDVCDYEGSNYRTRFWENQGRNYEDRVERIALGRLLPPTGDTLIDIGAGFGRLANLYNGYRRVILFDYSSSLLREARAHIGNDPRFYYVAGNWYQMPFVNGLFQTQVQVRTIHHAADVPALFSELQRIGRRGGDYVLEFANKQNIKAMARYTLKRQSWSPYQHDPIEFAKLNFDFHPVWMREKLIEAGFRPQQTLTVSHFRIGLLKKWIPTPILAQLDSWAQLTGDWWQLSPSVFTHNLHPLSAEIAPSDQFFACPTCHTPIFEQDEQLPCPQCKTIWRKQDGVYIFKNENSL